MTNDETKMGVLRFESVFRDSGASSGIGLDTSSDPAELELLTREVRSASFSRA